MGLVGGDITRARHLCIVSSRLHSYRLPQVGQGNELLRVKILRWSNTVTEIQENPPVMNVVDMKVVCQRPNVTQKIVASRTITRDIILFAQPELFHDR
jgi:hypothetical protein